jgi:hypothetical protein
MADAFLRREFGIAYREAPAPANRRGPVCAVCNRVAVGFMGGLCTNCRRNQRDARQAEQVVVHEPGRSEWELRQEENQRWAAAWAPELTRFAAWRDGREARQLFGGDPYVMANRMNLDVVAVAPSVLAANTGRPAAGTYFQLLNIIQVSDTLTAREARLTVAHECGHARGHGLEDDRTAELFALAFSGAYDNEADAWGSIPKNWGRDSA